ncbi:MAG: flagellar biosynthesis protein FlhG [Bacillota bacterium]|nr:flagellar biosynthesis protein FlhG [Bacillota bacterium]MDK2855174.1 flagellar biosynthesis protein FlhG [Bacillota bacterium]MDK2925028.1 flagellar biosynthesis protein FlhG [Bacillota bacterium]
MPDQAERLRELAREWGRKQLKPAGRVIAVASGKGGVGKTNFAVNLGLALRELGKTVTILDADLGLANVDVVLGITPTYTLAHVARREKSLPEVVCLSHGLKVVAGCSGFEELVDLPDHELGRLVKEAAELESDFFLIDTGAGIARPVISLALAAQEVVVITTPEPTSLTDAYALIKVLFRRNPHITLHLVVNRVASLAEGERVAENLKRVAEEFLDAKLNHLGSIPEDSAVRSCVARQEPLMCSCPGAPAAREFRQIAAALSGCAVLPAKGGLPGFLGRLRFLVR